MKGFWLAMYLSVFATGCLGGEPDSIATSVENGEPSPTASADVGGDADATAGVAEHAPSDNPAAELAAKHLEEVLAWQREFRRAPKEEREAVLAQRPSSSKYFVQFRELADKHPGSPIAASAHAWMAVSAPEAADRRESLRMLVDHHANSEELIDVISATTSFFAPSNETETQFKRLHERSENRNVQAAAVFGLIRLYEKTRGTSEKRGPNTAGVGRLRADGLESPRDHSSKMRELEELYTLLAEDYRDAVVKVMGRTVNLGAFADAGLFAIRHLQVGCIAPDIVGKDLDGVDFKLSDYRGNVVMLSFSANWCVPCKALYPHERSLVRQLADKPFALIGVNCDEDVAVARTAAEEQDLTWRCFWNGEQGASGPITKLWQVKSWPTIVLLDPSGRIRFKSNRPENLDDTIVALLAEMGHDVVIADEAIEQDTSGNRGLRADRPEDGE